MLFKRKKKLKKLLIEGFGKINTMPYNFDLIKLYHNKKDHSSELQILDEQTRNDLDVEDFFNIIDRTSSKIGQQYFYNTINTLSNDPNKFTKQEKLINFLNENKKIKLDIQLLLSKLNSTKSYYISSLFQDEFEKKPKWLFIIPLLSFTMFFSLFLSIFISKLLIVAIATLPINVAFHYLNKSKVNLYINSIPQLLTMNYVAKGLFKFDFIHDLYREKQKSIKVIDGIKRRMSIFKLEQKIDSEIGILYWFIMELLKITFLLEPLLLFSVIKELKNKNDDIENVFSLIGEIDQTISVSYIRDDIWTTCIPEISNKTEILSKEMTHPLLFNCISNDFSCTDKSYLLTGSNMSGKTTFIRAVGLNCISAMTINTCFAQSFTLPYLKITTAIRITDDLESSSSYFFNEVKAVKSIIDNSEKEQPNLFLLDEIFKGTNTLERISSSKAILSYIAKPNNFVFVSTHDIELTDMLHDKYDLYYFNESIENNKIIFDYKLKQGVPSKGNAISILELNDYPNTIIEEAKNTLLSLK